MSRDQVRFEFADAGGGEAVTGITVKWPVPLSKAFGERLLVEGLLQQFVQPGSPDGPRSHETRSCTPRRLRWTSSDVEPMMPLARSGVLSSPPPCTRLVSAPRVSTADPRGDEAFHLGASGSPVNAVASGTVTRT